MMMTVMKIKITLIVLVSSGCRNKYHRLGGVNNTNIFLTVLEAGNFKIKVQQGSASGKSSLPGL